MTADRSSTPSSSSADRASLDDLSAFLGGEANSAERARIGSLLAAGPEAVAELLAVDASINSTAARLSGDQQFGDQRPNQRPPPLARRARPTRARFDRVLLRGLAISALLLVGAAIGTVVGVAAGAEFDAARSSVDAVW